MTDDNDNSPSASPAGPAGPGSLAAGGRAPLTLKPRAAGAVSAGMIKQSFSHGRTKTVVEDQASAG